MGVLNSKELIAGGLALAMSAIEVGPPAPAMPVLRAFGARLAQTDSPANAATALAAIEGLIGRQLGSLTAFAEPNAARGTWQDALTETRAQITNLKPLNRPIYWAFPICNGTLGHGPKETLRGDHDETIKTMYREIIACDRGFIDPADGSTFFPIRLAWENTIYGAYPWGRAYLSPSEYRALWRYVAKIGKAIDPRFRFDFTPNNRIVGADGKTVDPRPYFPGRDLVSAIGVDAYVRYEIDFTVDGLTPQGAIFKHWDAEWGIMDLYRWARSLDLPFNIAETGINGSQDANNSATGDAYVMHYKRLAHFVRNYYVCVAAIWDKDNSPTSFNCRVSATPPQYPALAAAIAAGFSGAAVPWTPALHFGPDLVQHHSAMDAANMTVESGTNLVSEWRDRVSGKAAASSGTARPVYSATARNGKPGLTFDGGDDVLIQTDVTNLPAYAKGVTNVIQAYTFNDVGEFAYLMADSDATGGAVNTRGLNHRTGFGRLHSGGKTVTGSLIRGLDSTIIMSIRDAYSATEQTSQVSFNGEIPWSDGQIAVVPPTTMTKRVIAGNGAGSDGVANRSHSTVQEILSIRRSLYDRQEFELLQGYAAWTWGTVAALPASHPYKNAAPTYGGPMPAA